jgi:hypothetical protein
MTMVEEILATWREAERLLDSLPPVNPDHETVRLAVVRLQATYRQLTSDTAQTEEIIASSRATIAEAHQVLEHIRSKPGFGT